MPDRAREKTPKDAPQEQKPARNAGTWKILVIIGVIVGVQALLTVVLLPHLTGGPADAADRIDAEGEKIDEADANAKKPELEVGKFAVTNNVAAPDAALQLSFKVHVECAQDVADELTTRIEAYQFRVRHVIEVIARQATYKDLADPSLDLIQRHISKKLNELLGKDYVARAIVTDFRTYEQ
jgi:hypothetical protein